MRKILHTNIPILYLKWLKCAIIPSLSGHSKYVIICNWSYQTKILLKDFQKTDGF